MELPAEASPSALKAHDRTVATLIGSVAHDLGSPLAALSANVTMAREACEAAPKGDGAVLELLEDIASAVERLTHILDDMRGYAVTTDPVALELLPIVERAARIARSASARRAAIEVQIPHEVRVHASASLLTRLLAQTLVLMTQDLPPERADRVLSLRHLGSPRALVLALGPRGPLPAEVAGAIRDSAMLAGIDGAVVHEAGSVVVTFPLRGAS